MKDKISDHQILLFLQSIRNWKSFTKGEILAEGEGGDISHHTYSAVVLLMDITQSL